MIILTLYTTYQHVSVSNICQPRILTFCSFMIKIIDIAAIRLPAGTYPATQPATLLYFLPAACLLSESPGWSNIQYQILTVFSLPTVSPNILTKLVPLPKGYIRHNSKLDNAGHWCDPYQTQKGWD